MRHKTPATTHGSHDLGGDWSRPEFMGSAPRVHRNSMKNVPPRLRKACGLCRCGACSVSRSVRCASRGGCRQRGLGFPSNVASVLYHKYHGEGGPTGKQRHFQPTCYEAHPTPEWGGQRGLRWLKGAGNADAERNAFRCRQDVQKKIRKSLTVSEGFDIFASHTEQTTTTKT
jgi:hypothetical protein